MNNLVNKITQKTLRFKAFKRREYYHIHLRAHKLIGKVGIYLSNEPLRAKVVFFFAFLYKYSLNINEKI